MTEAEDLYQRYFKDVYLYVRALCGEEQLAEEITAETFLKALEGIENFQGKCDIRVWLCQIAKNSYYSYLRKNKRIVYEETVESKEHKPLEQLVEEKEMSQRIHEILHLLEEPYKEVFSLRVFGELSFRQIGELFGKNQNWACVTYHRARKKIVERLEEKR